MNRSLRMLLVVGLSVVVLLGGSLVQAANSTETGAAAFKLKCATCHGQDGSGAASKKVAGADLRTAEVQKMSDDDLYKAIAYGTGHKLYPHGFLTKGLNEAEIRSLVAFIRELGKRR